MITEILRDPSRRDNGSLTRTSAATTLDAMVRHVQQRGGDPIVGYRLAVETVAAGSSTPDEVLHALSELVNVRKDLDRVERELIGSARAQGIAWPEIAAALGLGSRQAAEQRWLRLSGDATRDAAAVRAQQRLQRIVDEQAGPEFVELRHAVIDALRRIDADRGWDDRHSRAALARTSLAAAATADPSAAYALCRNAMDDLDAMSAVRLPPVLAAVVRRLRQALVAATRASAREGRGG
jgi:hypothetical protein